MAMKHTPGPWRWEVNESSKVIHLVGGCPRFDLTIIDFQRWGMNGATMLLRDPALDGMNLMERCTRWAVKVTGREHHASWFKGIDHPDARLIEAAPALLALAHQYASECGDCAGTRIVAMVDDTGELAGDEPCEQCADIWTVIDKAEGRT